MEKLSAKDLVKIALSIPKEIFNTTSEIATGREEDAEAYYHNNLRKIECAIRVLLAKRVLGETSRITEDDIDSEKMTKITVKNKQAFV